MSDATIRELERAAREDDDAAAWTRLALARSRAGLDGAPAAVQALLRDAASPVRELLAGPTAPIPRALVAGRGAPLSLPGRLFRALPHHLLDLGRGRVLVVSRAEVVAVDLFGGDVLWRRGQPEQLPWPSLTVVGEHLLWTGTTARLEWAQLASGQVVGERTLPLAARSGTPVVTRATALGGAVCGVSAWTLDDGARATWLDLASGRTLGEVVLGGSATTHDPVFVAEADGAVVAQTREGVAARALDGRTLWARSERAPLAAAGRVVVLAGPGLVETVAAGTGRPLARIALSPGASARAALFAGDLLLLVEEPADVDEVPATSAATAGAELERVAAFDARTGEPSWTARLSARPVHHDLCIADDVVLVVGRVPGPASWRVLETTALDRVTGETLWAHRPDEAVVRPAGGLVAAIGPVDGWSPGKDVTLRRLAPAACDAT